MQEKLAQWMVDNCLTSNFWCVSSRLWGMGDVCVCVCTHTHGRSDRAIHTPRAHHLTKTMYVATNQQVGAEPGVGGHGRAHVPGLDPLRRAVRACVFCVSSRLPLLWDASTSGIAA